MRLLFEQFDVESTPLCEADALTLYEGPDNTSPQLAGSPLCGHYVDYPLASEGTVLYMEFTTNMTRQHNGMAGFSVKVELCE